MIITLTLNLRSDGETDIIDITKDVHDLLKTTRLANGIVTLFVPGSTGGLTTIEYEDGVVKDLKNVFERVAPRNAEYKHNSKWGDGNGFSHVRASLIGPSMSVPFSGGNLMLGTWQQIVFIDFDNRPRSREIVAQFIGEK